MSGLAAGALVSVAAGTSSAISSVAVTASAAAAIETGFTLMLYPSLRSGQQGPAGKSHLAGLLVYLKELDIHLVSDLKHILHLVHLLVIQLGNVQQTLLAGQYLHKCTEFQDRHHLTVVNLTYLGNGCDGLPW